MNILTSYTLKYLRLNKKRTAVTVLGATLSTALICGVFLLGVSFQKVMIDHEVFMSGNWHVRFHGVPAAQAKYITENSAVKTAMMSTSVGVATDGSLNRVRPYLYITAYDTPSFQNLSVRLLSGRFPQKEGELVVSPVMIADSGLDLKPGSTLSLGFGRRVILNRDEMVKAWGGEEFVALGEGETFALSSAQTYTVVGVMEPRFDETSMPAAFPALTYLDTARAADKVDVAVLARDARSIDTSAPLMAHNAGLAKEAISYNEKLLPWLGGSGRSNYVSFVLVIVATLVFLIVGVSALVIYNAFAISIGERKKQFGMFASVGATPPQIRRIVLIEAGFIALVGITVGIGGAVAVTAVLLQLTQGLVSQVIVDARQGLPLVVSPLAIGLTALFSAATIVVSAWLPAQRASRVSPIDAIRQGGGVQNTKTGSLRTNSVLRRVWGFEGELALKSIKRDRKRSFTTLLSLLVSIVLFVAFNSFALYTNITRSMAVKAMNFDLMIDLDYRQSHAPQFSERVGQLPEVQRVAYRRSTYEQYIPARSVITDAAHHALKELNGLKLENIPRPVEGGTYEFLLEVTSVGPQEFTRYAAQLGLDEKEFLDPSTPRGILINHPNLRQNGKLYDFELFNLKPGDAFMATKLSEWTGPVGEGPISLTWTVGAVTEQTPLGLMGVTLVPELIVSDTVFDALNDKLLQLGPVNPGHMTVKSDDPDAALKAIERLYEATVGGHFSYQSMAEFNKAGSLQTLLINLVFYAFLALITLIGVTSIINTLDTNIKLRRREFAMLRSVGLTPGGLRRLLRYESLFYGVTALVLGLPLGIVLSVVIYYQFDGVSTFAFTLPWEAIGGCIAGVLVIVFATMMAAGAMVRNDRIADAIKAENQ